jgi:hypothetical protein
VLASTVTPATLLLYDLTVPSAPVLVPPADYITEPCEFASSGVSPVIALQPAGATACDASSVFRTRPLKDNTEYAVVIGDGVKDKAGKAIGAGTVARILLFDNPLVSLAGASQLQGVDDATAGGLEVMRNKLKPVLAAAAGAPGITKAHVAMAYTFKTQSFLGVAAQLGALPYVQSALTAVPGPVTPAPGAATAAAAFARYGVDPSVPSGNVGEVLETTLTTFNLLDPATGAFHADPALAVGETVKVLVATPRATSANLAACSGAMAPFAPLKCAPMMIFRHGLGGGRADMLAVADGFAAQGLVTVAIDAAKHGDRSFCTGGDATTVIPGTTTSVPVCADGAACVTALPPGAQGDAKPPGTCAAGFYMRPVSPGCLASPASCGWSGADGIPWVSSNYLVSANFFRSRDTFRQDIIDESQLARAIAFVPTGPPPTASALFDRMAAAGVVVDPARVYYSGQSLGAIQGTMTVAANPRVTRAVLNVGGGTVVDIFTSSPAFADSTAALLAGLGIAPGTASYLQFLAVSKMILDPADPVNYAGHLTASTLPDLLANPSGSVAQAPKSILAQVALCDQVVPNAFNYVWASNIGVGPLPGDPAFGAGTGTFELFFKLSGAPPTPAQVAQAIQACGFPGAASPNQVSHGFLADWADPTITARAQADAAAFVLSDASPSSLVFLP